MVDYSLSDLFLKNSTDKQLIISTDDATTNITNTELHQEKFELTESLCSEKELVFGSCESSVVKFTVSNIFLPMKSKWITVKLILDGNNDNPFQIGKYKVYSDIPTADRTKREVTAYDALYDVLNADVAAWYNTLLPKDDSKVTLKEFRNSFFGYFEIEQEEVQLVNDGITIEKTINPEELSGATVVNAICEINGCFGHINRNGKFVYVYLAQEIQGLYPSDGLFPSDELYPKPPKSVQLSKNIYIDASFEDYLTKTIDKLQIKQTESDIGAIVGSGTNAYIIEDNFLVYGKKAKELNTIAENIYNKIKGIFYRPFTCNSKGNLCLEVGDAVRIPTKYAIIESYILQRTLSGIQALRDNYSAEGEEERSAQVNSANRAIIQLKGKTNELVRNVEQTKQTITDVEAGLKNEIVQTAKGTTETIANNSTVWYEGDITINLYGYGPPDNNYMASADYVEKNYLDKSSGYYYICKWGGNASNPYRWGKLGKLDRAEAAFETKIEETAEGITETIEKNYQKKSEMSNYPTTESMSLEIEKSVNGISETISKSQKIWDISELDEDLIIYGYSYPDNITYPVADYSGKTFINQSDGKVYKVVNGVWKYQKQLILISQKLENEIKETAGGFSIEVSKARTLYDTGGRQFDLYGWGSPIGRNNPADYPLKMYLDQSSGLFYQATQLSVNEYVWTKSGQLEAKCEDFSTGYYQTEQSISQKVSVGDVSNQITIEKSGVNISGNRLTVDSDNFKLSGSGEVELIGSVKTGNDGDYAQLSGKDLKFYESDSLSGSIFGNKTSAGNIGLLLATSGNYIGMGTKEGITTTLKYVLDNGYGYPYRHVFFDDTNFSSGLYVGGIAHLPKINISDETTINALTVLNEEYMTVHGNFTVTGKKSRAVQTENYGKRLMNAVESPTPFFSDYGTGSIKDGKCYIYFDEIFRECVNTQMEYFVSITPTSESKVGYVKKNKDYFVVFGEEEATFDWTVTARQKGYENERMERLDDENVDNDISIPYDMSIFFGDNIAANESLAYAEKLDYAYAEKAINYVETIQRDETEVLEND